MIIIISEKGIFDASGCYIWMSLDHELKLTSLSSKSDVVVAVFENGDRVDTAYDEVLAAIKEGNRLIEIEGDALD